MVTIGAAQWVKKGSTNRKKGNPNLKKSQGSQSETDGSGNGVGNG